jgi:arsenate reductase
VEIWHNPRCSKSRAAKRALDEAGVDHVERRYLDDPPTAAELSDVLTRLGMQPWEITRKGEARFEELDLAALPHDRQRWIEVLAANPVLIERPVVVREDRAVVARTPEAIAAVLQ